MTSTALRSLKWPSHISAMPSYPTLGGPTVPRCITCSQWSIMPALPLVLEEVKTDLTAHPEPELSAL